MSDRGGSEASIRERRQSGETESPGFVSDIVFDTYLPSLHLIGVGMVSALPASVHNVRMPTRHESGTVQTMPRVEINDSGNYKLPYNSFGMITFHLTQATPGNHAAQVQW